MKSAEAAYDAATAEDALKGTERAAELRERQGRPRLAALAHGLHVGALCRASAAGRRHVPC